MSWIDAQGCCSNCGVRVVPPTPADSEMARPKGSYGPPGFQPGAPDIGMAQATGGPIRHYLSGAPVLSDAEQTRIAANHQRVPFAKFRWKGAMLQQAAFDVAENRLYWSDIATVPRETSDREDAGAG